MSNAMYNDESNWKEIVKNYLIHDDKQIKGFFGDYRWLSNFEPCHIWYEGATYPSVENAYQAAKILPEYRVDELQYCSAVEAKKNWKKYPKINETSTQWDARKYQVMAGLVFNKFLNNLDLRQKLLDTGDRYLEETNHWHDRFYGVCICKKCKNTGKNNLGKILMQTRKYWQNK